MPKRFNAVLCGICRDEDRYIVEWVAYHLALGFEHVFLFDNMSARPVDRIIASRVARERVTVIRWPSIKRRRLDAQLSAYQHFLHTYREASHWGAVLDLDEFLNLKRDRTVHDFLGRFPTADAVAVNWRMFGSGGAAAYVRRPVVERFTRASPLEFGANVQVKTLYRLDRVDEIHHHNGDYAHAPEIRSPDGRVVGNGPFVPPSPEAFGIAQVNHYFTKSLEEWRLKNRRGYADGTVRTDAVFEANDRNEHRDTTILRRRRRMAAEMRRVALRRSFLPRRYTILDRMIDGAMDALTPRATARRRAGVRAP